MIAIDAIGWEPSWGASENPTDSLSMWLPGVLHIVVTAFGQQENKEIKEGDELPL